MTKRISAEKLAWEAVSAKLCANHICNKDIPCDVLPAVVEAIKSYAHSQAKPLVEALRYYRDTLLHEGMGNVAQKAIDEYEKENP